VIELVYDAAAGPLILTRFPHAKIEDAHDSIHESRIQVTLPDEDKDAFFKHAMKEGYYEVCLGFQMMMMDHDGLAKINQWLRELKDEKERGA
jgi:hypothetical protein